MDPNKLTISPSSLELQVQDLKLPALSDFSKVKLVLSVNNYTQCLVYPFKTMTIPSVDDYSVLEISIMHLNSVIAGIEVPLTLFKNKKSQTFKLHSNHPGKRSPPDKGENNEITLSIKFWPNDSPINAYKEHIKELEKKVKESEEKVGVGMRTQRDLQDNFEEITKNLAKMIRNQEETINNLVSEKEKMNEYLKEVEIELKKKSLNEEENEDFRFCGRIFNSEMNLKGNRRMKSFESRNKKENLTKGGGKGAKGQKEYVEQLEVEVRAVKVENEQLRNSLREYRQQVEDLEYKLSEMSLSTSGDKVSEKQSSGLVLSLRSEMSKMAAKYKNRINKLSESRNNLIQENKILAEKNLELEKQLNIKPTEIPKPLENKPSSYKLLGKYANNIQKVENYLAKSPKPPKDSESLDKYLQILHTPPSFRKKTPELKSSRSQKDPVDTLLEDFTSKSDLPIQFVKESEGIYTFGSKRVFIKLENQKLFIRIGAGFMSVEDFIKSYLPVELERQNRDKSRELEGKAGPFSKVVKEEKFVTCFGVQRRSASASKLPSKPAIYNNY